MSFLRKSLTNKESSRPHTLLFQKPGQRDLPVPVGSPNKKLPKISTLTATPKRIFRGT